MRQAVSAWPGWSARDATAAVWQSELRLAVVCMGHNDNPAVLLAWSSRTTSCHHTTGEPDHWGRVRRPLPPRWCVAALGGQRQAEQGRPTRCVASLPAYAATDESASSNQPSDTHQACPAVHAEMDSPLTFLGDVLCPPSPPQFIVSFAWLLPADLVLSLCYMSISVLDLHDGKGKPSNTGPIRGGHRVHASPRYSITKSLSKN